MSKVAKFVVSPFNAVFGNKATAAVLAIASAIPGPHQPFALAASAAFGAYQRLTAPKPVARGSPAQVTIDIEPPRPYIVGQVMTGGVMRHDVAYGPTLKKVPNPYRWQVRVLSGVGTIQGIVGQYFDFEPVNTSYYSGFFTTVQNLGARPQATALVPPYGAAPGWTGASRLSGCAHVGLNFKFDKDGKRFASGIPAWTALVDGEKVYDPRLDSTYPGGSGSCRAGVESTYVYNRNPACHAVTYALGRFQNGIRIFGPGQAVDTIDMAAIVDWANDCDANGWTVNMVLLEGGTGANLREQRVRNLDDLCAAGGGRWYQAGGLLSFDWHRPRVSLATLTDDDILEAGGGTDAVPTVRNRMNGVRPQYVSPSHNWQQITANEIIGSTYRTEDGSRLTQVWPLNGVTNESQAGELASYAMADSREIGPMDVQAKQNWRFYRPGDCIEVDSSLMAYQGQAIINQRSLDPQNFSVALQLKSETPGKHDFALGKVADPPPTPVLAQTQEERDLIADAAFVPRPEDIAEVNELITIDSDGRLNGIGTGSGEFVNNKGVIPSGLLADRPVSGAFINQAYYATDTREIYTWDGFNWRASADVTATAQRSIVPQFPVIEIKEGEAGSVGNGTRTVTHTALRSTTTLMGGSWALPAENLGTGDAAINSGTGTVSLTGIDQSGSYTVLYAHTDGLPTVGEVNVLYVPIPPGGVTSAKVARAASINGTLDNNSWQNIVTLSVPGVPAGRVRFGGLERLSFIDPQGGTGTADFEARLQLDGVTLTSLLSQNVVTGGVLSFADFSELFNGSFAVSAGTRVFTIDLRRTSGSGTITSTNTALEATIIAS